MKSLILLTSLFTISCTTTQGTRELSSVARTQNAADALVAECEVISEILQIQKEDDYVIWQKAVWEKITEKDASGRMKIAKPECIDIAISLYEETCQSYEDFRTNSVCEVLFVTDRNDRMTIPLRRLMLLLMSKK